MYFEVISENKFEKMKTLKKLTLLSCLVLGLSMLTFSCKKDKIYTIEGKWEGTFYLNGNAPPYFAFQVKSGGTLDVMNNAADKNQITATGTWTVVNGVFTTDIDWNGLNTSFTSPFNAKSATLSGTWGYTPSTTDGGTWTMTKQ
jgi:hypothetical protein